MKQFNDFAIYSFTWWDRFRFTLFGIKVKRISSDGYCEYYYYKGKYYITKLNKTTKEENDNDE